MSYVKETLTAECTLLQQPRLEKCTSMDVDLRLGEEVGSEHSLLGNSSCVLNWQWAESRRLLPLKGFTPSLSIHNMYK